MASFTFDQFREVLGDLDFEKIPPRNMRLGEKFYLMEQFSGLE